MAVNDITDNETLAHLLQYDSVFGKYPGEVHADGDSIVVDGKRIACSRSGTPGNLPWGEVGADIVVESTGNLHRPRQGPRCT